MAKQRLLFVSDFDGALITTNTDTLIFKKIDPLMENVVKAVLKHREQNIWVLEKDGLLQLAKEAGANISSGKKWSCVRWRPTSTETYLPQKALQTTVGKWAIQYYGNKPVPVKEFFSALIPDNREIEDYLGNAKNVWSAYDRRFSQLLKGEINQLGFHEFVDAVFTKLFKYSDVVEASAQIAEHDIRGGVDDLFELLCSKKVHIAICSYSYIDTVQIVLKQLVSRHIPVKKTPFDADPITGTIVANKILCNDLYANTITTIMHIGNKWEVLDSKLADVGFKKNLDGRYPNSIAYEDDPNSIKDMVPRYPVSILLIKDKNKNCSVDEIKASTGERFDESVKLEICYETLSGGVNGLVEIVRHNLKSMCKGMNWPYGALLSRQHPKNRIF